MLQAKIIKDDNTNKNKILCPMYGKQNFSSGEVDLYK